MTIKSIRWEQGNDAASVAKALASFVSAARQSLHIAIYDFRLDGDEKATVVDAITAAAKRVDVKIAFDDTEDSDPTDKAMLGSDPAPPGTKQFVEQNFPAASKVKTRAIAGSHLMHSKYVIRDGATADAAVWMGSANFTNDAWTLQENNVLEVASQELAKHYETDFASLFESGNIKGTGENDYGSLTIGSIPVEFGFAPGEGSAVASLFVDAIQGAGAGGTVYVATMVLSSGAILGALVDHLHAGGKLVGVYDATQMQGVVNDWKRSKTPSPKLALWQAVAPHLAGKHSKPYTPTGAHDFMHDKLLVTSKVVLTGSFNLSENAESNAENVLAVHDPKLAAAYTTYIEALVKKYGAK
jgi:phosphatidylserine/phosphatidylglycerophosphate/cardiolipin synthase-like enzyme